jgi:transcriptional regulator with XRE-family HTH domain
MFIFGEHLKSIRLLQDKKQQETASAINITLRNYQKFEHGEVKPSFDNLIALADYFDVSIDSLVGRTECRERYPMRRDGDKQ